MTTAVLDIGMVRVVDTGDSLVFLRDTDIQLLYLDNEARQKLFQHLLNDHNNKK